jgi:hypothetical protein
MRYSSIKPFLVSEPIRLAQPKTITFRIIALLSYSALLLLAAQRNG